MLQSYKEKHNLRCFETYSWFKWTVQRASLAVRWNRPRCRIPICLFISMLLGQPYRQPAFRQYKAKPRVGWSWSHEWLVPIFRWSSNQSCGYKFLGKRCPVSQPICRVQWLCVTWIAMIEEVKGRSRLTKHEIQTL